MKKKAYYEGIEAEFAVSQRENGKLKLENAALRAENQLLKRYLTYFENLFAKKSGVTVTQADTKQDESMVALEIKQPSSAVVDLEAPAPQYPKVISVPVKRDHVTKEHDPSEVSFVLERNFGGDGSNGGPNS